MPDIRTFFTPKGGSQASSQEKQKATASANRKASAKKRRVVDSDDEEDEPTPKKTAPKKTPTKKTAAKEEKKEEPTTTSAFFASNGKNKISRSNEAKSKVVVEVKPEKKPVQVIDNEDEDMKDGIHEAEFKKAEDDYMEDDDMDDFVVPDDEEDFKPKKATASRSKKRKSLPSDDEDENEEADAKPKRGAKGKSTPAKTPAKKPAPKKPRATAKKEPEPENEEMKKLLDAIPTVRPPTPPPRSEDGAKFNFRANMQKPGPIAEGSKEPPTGADNCLSGLTFVFTGVLESLSREDGTELVKRYGGKVTSAPSKKTSYVVLGSEAGPKKLETIRNNGIKTINEDGLFALIRTLPANGGDSTVAKANEAKKKEEEKKVMEMAKQMDKEASEKPKEEVAKANADLWTVKYAPTAMNQICGNKGLVDKLQRWLHDWPKNRKIKFMKRGADGSGGYRAAMLHGPPGIGKTTAAHLVAKLEGYDILELNASDTRSKKLMEASLRGVLDNTSVAGYFGAGKEKADASKKKLVLIMDEVDGMSAGDRGGVGMLASVCKKTSIPIICICNDRRLPKMKPFDGVTMDMAFRRPDANMIRSRIMSIAYKEGLKVPPAVIDQLVEGTHADIRQIINMLSTYKTTAKSMDFDQGKSMAKSWEKHIVLKPWDIAEKLLGTSMFGPTNNKTLNDKIELYFNDHEFSYLMVQENYLKTNPSRASKNHGGERTLKLLELADEAAQSISDGDLVDAMIHGPQQHWSLMPTHGMFSTVIPSSYQYGGYTQRLVFTQWLGNNSKQGKLARYVKELQSHIRLRTSGDRHEVRQQYLPAFFNMLVRRLEMDGKDALEDIYELMDSYFLTREDWDAIVELGVGPMAEDTVQIPTQIKTAFTKGYNQMSHPMPFMKASNVTAPVKGAKKEVPDNEDVIIESEDEAPPDDVDVAKDDENDLSKDKYVSQPKKKAAPKGKGAEGAKKAPAKGKGKATTSKGAAKGKGKK